MQAYVCTLCAAVLAFAGLGGCATRSAYTPIDDPGFKGPAMAVVLADPSAYVGSRVRWGGEIAQVENRAEETWIEVVERDLHRYGRPQEGGASRGRFVARIVGFLDPAIYEKGRQLTVTGVLQPAVKRNIGEYPYTFPVVAVENYKLWEEEPAVRYIDPYWPYYWPYDFYRGRRYFAPWDYRYPYYW
ncbi:MAG: Slp family lipoprotein [Pseudomonadota bacterium]|nr:Slp family lipoprotein [Pseudomonadota bacterium]